MHFKINWLQTHIHQKFFILWYILGKTFQSLSFIECFILLIYAYGQLSFCKINIKIYFKMNFISTKLLSCCYVKCFQRLGLSVLFLFLNRLYVVCCFLPKTSARCNGRNVVYRFCLKKYM